jgi:hypothetical protein
MAVEPRAKRIVDFSEYAGKWVAQGEDGSVLESADSLSSLTKILIHQHHYPRENLPAAWLVPKQSDDILAV